MAMTRSTWTDDDGSGTTGTVINNAELQKIYNNVDALVGGIWQTPVFNAADYVGSGSMVWTVAAGHVSMNRYVVIGKTLIWNVYITGAPLTGTPANYLLMKLPGGLTARGANSGTAATSQLFDGVHQAGFVTVAAGGLQVQIQKITEGNFAIGTTYIRFAIAAEIN